MHCSSSPSHSTASGWTDSAGSKAIITHGLSEGSRKPPGSHPSMSQWAAATVSRHARRGPPPPPSATASSAMGCSSGATMRAFRTRGPCGCASTSSRHGSSGPRSGAGVASPPAAAMMDASATWKPDSKPSSCGAWHTDPRNARDKATTSLATGWDMAPSLPPTGAACMSARRRIRVLRPRSYDPRDSHQVEFRPVRIRKFARWPTATFVTFQENPDRHPWTS